MIKRMIKWLIDWMVKCMLMDKMMDCTGRDDIGCNPSGAITDPMGSLWWMIMDASVIMWLRDWIHMEYSMYWDCWLDVDIPVD